MRSPEAVYEELEGDHRSREGEIRLVQRLLTTVSSTDEQEILRRSLVLLVYAHLEGFCKFALLAYAAAVNSMNLNCSEAAYPVAAASLSKVFAALRNPSSKHEIFRRTLPDDAKLHLAAREQIFIESYKIIFKQKIDIPDEAVDTQSNLSSVVLKKVIVIDRTITVERPVGG